MSRSNAPSLLDGWHTALSSYVDTTESNLKGMRKPSPRVNNHGRDVTPTHRVSIARLGAPPRTCMLAYPLTSFQAAGSCFSVLQPRSFRCTHSGSAEVLPSSRYGRKHENRDQLSTGVCTSRCNCAPGTCVSNHAACIVAKPPPYRVLIGVFQSHANAGASTITVVIHNYNLYKGAHKPSLHHQSAPPSVFLSFKSAPAHDPSQIGSAKSQEACTPILKCMHQPANQQGKLKK